MQTIEWEIWWQPSQMWWFLIFKQLGILRFKFFLGFISFFCYWNIMGKFNHKMSEFSCGWLPNPRVEEMDSMGWREFLMDCGDFSMNFGDFLMACGDIYLIMTNNTSCKLSNIGEFTTHHSEQTSINPFEKCQYPFPLDKLPVSSIIESWPLPSFPCQSPPVMSSPRSKYAIHNISPAIRNRQWASLYLLSFETKTKFIV